MAGFGPAEASMNRKPGELKTGLVEDWAGAKIYEMHRERRRRGSQDRANMRGWEGRRN